MEKNQKTPDFVFEASWEVCNKVGGIYTVLSSKAKTMIGKYKKDNVIFIGPDVWKENPSPWFKEDIKLLASWKKTATEKDGLKIKIGKWQVPGNPIAILVDFDQYYANKDSLYGHIWEKYSVNSLHAYGDYDEACMFAYASAKVIESFYKYNKLDSKNVIAHFDEWMMGMGLLHINEHLPKVATVFTTHATTVGRSIAGNGKPLYNELSKYNGDQMSQELGVEAKHSLEKVTAHTSDCFTTVSAITARESKFLLERTPEVTPNGFEKGFIPKGEEYTKKQKEARDKMLLVAERLLGYSLKKDTMLIATSGRYEYRNKGLDVFIDSLARLNKTKGLKKEVVAFIMVPGWVKEAREDLQTQMKAKKADIYPLHEPYVTHWLHNMQGDQVLNQLRFLNLNNKKTDKVKVIFVPSYLNGNDGIFDMAYYDLLIGMNLTVFPSYYEPWGYTPHESIAFSIPTITTTLAGFGMWMHREGDERGMIDGAEVVVRDDYNFVEVSSDICNRIFEMTTKTEKEKLALGAKALERADLADWKHFYQYYEEAYALALENTEKRNK